MRYLISFNESFRVESIRGDVMDIFYSEVEGFNIYDSVLSGELVFTIQNRELYGGSAIIKPFKLGELDSFIRRLFRWADISPCEMNLSYKKNFSGMDRVGLGTISSGDLVSLGEKVVDKLIIRIRVFQ